MAAQPSAAAEASEPSTPTTIVVTGFIGTISKRSVSASRAEGPQLKQVSNAPDDVLPLHDSIESVESSASAVTDRCLPHRRPTDPGQPGPEIGVQDLERILRDLIEDQGIDERFVDLSAAPSLVPVSRLCWPMPAPDLRVRVVSSTSSPPAPRP